MQAFEEAYIFTHAGGTASEVTHEIICFLKHSLASRINKRSVGILINFKYRSKALGNNAAIKK